MTYLRSCLAGEATWHRAEYDRNRIGTGMMKSRCGQVTGHVLSSHCDMEVSGLLKKTHDRACEECEAEVERGTGRKW